MQQSPRQSLLRQHEWLVEMRRRLASAMHEKILRQGPLLGNLWHRLAGATRAAVSVRQHRLELAMRGLHSVSPLATLDRGYAIVEDVASGKVLLRGSDTARGSDIRARLAHGEITATVTSTKDEDD